MYNRYIPQPDGSYRRNRMADTTSGAPSKAPPRQQPSYQEQPPPAKQEASPSPTFHPPIVSGGSITGFLRQLLPKDFDTADLIIVLLLLLMAGDNEKERSTALLTMALYFIM